MGSVSCEAKTEVTFIVAYLLKIRTVEPEKQLLLGNCCVTRNNGVTAASGVFCAVRVEVKITATSCH
jgi:hypothetical protein